MTEDNSEFQNDDLIREIQKYQSDFESDLSEVENPENEDAGHQTTLLKFEKKRGKNGWVIVNQNNQNWENCKLLHQTNETKNPPYFDVKDDESTTTKELNFLFNPEQAAYSILS